MQLNDLMISVSDNTLSKMLKVAGGVAEKAVGVLYGTFGKVPRLELTEKVKEEATQMRVISFC